ncbi:MAG TPA: HNH endonuclease [Candidatus Dojkabacteria bacterium]|nr:HNH endonuclease [Candidatus Dojkabacteria bacterium]
MAIKNPPWQRDELILALDLYFRFTPSHISKSHPEVIKLSNILNSLPIHKERPDRIKFRNPNGVYMKLCNFLRYDPDYQGVGLQRGGKLEEIIWKEFYNDKVKLSNISKNIINGITELNNIDIETSDDLNDEENEFPEGKVLYKLHKYRERNNAAITRLKEIAESQGKLFCIICGFDFYKVYGKIGKGYIECHHTLPVSEYKHKKTTKIEELVLVCSNCHRMLHRKRPWLSIKELTSLIIK